MMRSSREVKFIVVTGGVLSGLGKGVAAASIGGLLSHKLKVVPIKCDGYLNTDPGTMNPTEHGEVYVLDDGGEVDMDFGHYERYLNVQAKFKWNLTMGKVFKEILEREREGAYLGRTVQFIPHVVDLIKAKFFEIAEEEEADVVLIEVGGTVGDLENQFYLEAVRQLPREVGQGNVMFVHLTYIPIPSGVSEQKSKPSQMSVRDLNEKGIYPDLVIGRCSEYLTPQIKRKIASFANLDPSRIISGVDVDNVYEIPLIYITEGVPEICNKVLGLYAPPMMEEWRTLVERINSNHLKPRKTIEIAICGKYTTLEDSYASIIESLQHAGAHCDLRVDIRWVDTEKVEGGFDPAEALKGVDGMIVPGGFGSRGIEGKISVIRHAREHGIPFLGICYGTQRLQDRRRQHRRSGPGWGSRRDRHHRHPAGPARREGLRRHHAPGGPRRGAPSRQRSRHSLRRRTHPRAVPSPLRGQPGARGDPAGGRPALLRQVQLRRDHADVRSGGPPLLRRLPVPPRAHLDPAQALPPVPGAHPGRREAA